MADWNKTIQGMFAREKSGKSEARPHVGDEPMSADDKLEPVAWMRPDWHDPRTNNGQSPVTVYRIAGWVPLVPASALEASEATIASLTAERDRWKENHDEMVRRNAVLRERPDLPVDRLPAIAQYEGKVASLTAENATLREELDRALYAIHYADIAYVGLKYPDDGIAVCTGKQMHKLTAAMRLKDCGLVVVEDSPDGPLVRWAPGRARAALRQEGKP